MGGIGVGQGIPASIFHPVLISPCGSGQAWSTFFQVGSLLNFATNAPYTVMID
jgi:hypothetical protein